MPIERIGRSDSRCVLARVAPLQAQSLKRLGEFGQLPETPIHSARCARTSGRKLDQMRSLVSIWPATPRPIVRIWVQIAQSVLLNWPLACLEGLWLI